MFALDKTNIAEIKRRADIRDVWSALGGPELRGNRGQAFWRGGDGYSVALDFEKGLWHDHRDGDEPRADRPTSSVLVRPRCCHRCCQRSADSKNRRP